MKLLNNHYFSTLSCYNTRLLDSLQAKFLRLPSRSRPFILPCSCKFSVCPKNRVSVFRFMKKKLYLCKNMFLFPGRHFWNRKCRKKTWWQQEFAVLKCEATANSVTGHVCVNSNKNMFLFTSRHFWNRKCRKYILTLI